MVCCGSWCFVFDLQVLHEGVVTAQGVGNVAQRWTRVGLVVGEEHQAPDTQEQIVGFFVVFLELQMSYLVSMDCLAADSGAFSSWKEVWKHILPS